MFVSQLYSSFLPLRYKVLKDNASLSGRGAMKQWVHFNAMDDLLGGDPSVLPIAVESCPIPNGMLQFFSSVYCLPVK